jgi:hypothetical protein
MWFEMFTGRQSRCPGPAGPAPDLKEVIPHVQALLPMAAQLVNRAERLVRLADMRPLPAAAMKEAQREEEMRRGDALTRGLASPASSPATIALLRDFQNDDGSTLAEMARSRVKTYRRWHARLAAILSRLGESADIGTSPIPIEQSPVYPAA